MTDDGRRVDRVSFDAETHRRMVEARRLLEAEFGCPLSFDEVLSVLVREGRAVLVERAALRGALPAKAGRT